MLSRTETDRKDSQIQFISSHYPALSPGEYTIQVSQTLEISAPETISETYNGKLQRIRIQTPNTRLNPQQIGMVYPPEGSLGEYGQSLPHIVLTPSTLPWEKNALRSEGSKVHLWLALLLFSEKEYERVEQGSLSGANADQPAAATISVPTPLLNEIMPTAETLEFLTHVRQNVDTYGKIEGEGVAVVMGSRIPRPGNNIVHLVAVDGQYTQQGFAPVRGEQNGKQVLITFKRWRFASIDPRFGFEQLLMGLNQGFIEHEPSSHDVANRYLKMGASLVPHHMRQGNKSAVWYRGPLVPGHHNRPVEVAFPVRSADALVRYNDATGLFDVSYATAWELGRLLMLNSKGVAFDLYRWKQAHAQAIKTAERQIDHLPFDGPSPNLNLPSSVVSWFKRTALLEGVPFHNIVIDEKLLPEESIRFFEVDWHWIEALLDGAFSIGRVTAIEHHRERLLEQAGSKLPERRMTGFLLRSAVVAGHPDLQVDGYTKTLPLNGPETALVFDTKDDSLAAHLTEAGRFDQTAMVQVREHFIVHGQPLSETFTVDQRAWFITDDDGPTYEVIQTSNNKLDVRRYNASQETWTFKGQIGAEFEVDLINGRFPPRFIRAMAQIDIVINENMGLKGSRWLLSDPREGLFLIEYDGITYKVFHEYRNPLLRFERLSKNVMIGIFEGKISALDFHLKPEVLHHGFHKDSSGRLFKYKRDANGTELSNGSSVPVPTLETAADGVVDILDLVTKITETREASEFALQMVEGVPKIRFTIGTP